MQHVALFHAQLSVKMVVLFIDGFITVWGKKKLTSAIVSMSLKNIYCFDVPA